MSVEALFGLPAHPLIVHGAVVLLPMAAFATIVCAAVPPLRRSYAPLALGVAVASTVAVFFAQESGEELSERVRRTALVRDHIGMGNHVLPWAVGVVIVAAAITAVPYVARTRPALAGTAATIVIVVLALAVGGGATWSTVRVGHSGAKATWSDDEVRARGR